MRWPEGGLEGFSVLSAPAESGFCSLISFVVWSRADFWFTGVSSHDSGPDKLTSPVQTATVTVLCPGAHTPTPESVGVGPLRTSSVVNPHSVVPAGRAPGLSCVTRNTLSVERTSKLYKVLSYDPFFPFLLSSRTSPGPAGALCPTSTTADPSYTSSLLPDLLRFRFRSSHLSSDPVRPLWGCP